MSNYQVPSQSLQAIKKLFGTKGFTEDDELEIVVSATQVLVNTYSWTTHDPDAEYAWHLMASYQVQRMPSRRWIRARWSVQHNQWQSNDFTAAFTRDNPHICYCTATTLNQFDRSIKTYHSAYAALKAALNQVR